MKFKCKQTGNIIEVPETEVANMLQMEHYEPVKEEKKTLTLKEKK